jgi:hypothetical protein
MVLIHRRRGRPSIKPTRSNDIPLFVVLAGKDSDYDRLLSELDKLEVPYRTSVYIREEHYSRVMDYRQRTVEVLPSYGVFIVWMYEDTQIVQFDPDQIVIRGTKGLGGLLFICHVLMIKDKRV